MLLGMLAAFAFGAVHALSPGHGKTLVAAYLVGSRGTPRHAVFLGLMVTFTHTISVFALGLVTLYLSRFVLPETITPILGAISGITIVWVGGTLLYRRTVGRKIAAPATGTRPRSRRRPRAHACPGRDQRGRPDCPGRERRTGSVPFRAGAAADFGGDGPGCARTDAADGVQRGPGGGAEAVGLAVLYAKHWLPDSASLGRSKAMRYLPVASAAFIVCIGIAMTWVSLRPPH